MSDQSPEKKQTVLRFDKGTLVHSRRPLINPQSQDGPTPAPLDEIAKQTNTLYSRGDTPKLDITKCPGVAPTNIQVVNADTIDAALYLTANYTNPKNVCILNMANARTAGGGWMRGALAQEEALCYRTSLSLTLRYKYYPLPEDGGIYSPLVLVIRKSTKDGHGLMDMTETEKLPVISVVSVAAVCQPPTETDHRGGIQRYVSGADVRLMEEKMRVILRIAAKNGHRQIVLGAFGCGAFGNPKEEVARMWESVLSEAEFGGGWWQDVVFAVLDTDERGNFATFYQRLDGIAV